MKFDQLGNYAQDQRRAIACLDNSLWRVEAQTFLRQAEQGDADLDTILQWTHMAQRLRAIAMAGLANDVAFRDAVVTKKLPSWQDYGAPPAMNSLQDSLAAKLYNAQSGQDKIVIINVGEGARRIGAWLVQKALNDHIDVLVSFSDAEFNALVLNHANEDGVRALAADFVQSRATASKIMTARPGLPEHETIKVLSEKAKLYALETKSFGERTSSGELFYTLTVIPTRKDAAVDGIAYEEYIKLFFEMCDQPWDGIGLAQEALIKEFNAADKVRITNKDGTDITMSLVDHDGRHFTFCNSLIAKNVPGSEIFSAPRLDSVEGIIVAKGKFSEHGKEIIENLTMEFRAGRLENFSAERGQDVFAKIINVDEGAHFVGELGIGTNPHLTRHVVNGLLVEKIGGSFHLALGRPYTYTEYAGKPVHVDNGGRSALHWDITTMLKGRGGRIYLDGRLIMDDGLWLDTRYDVLNRGWAAIPRDERPDYWKDYY